MISSKDRQERGQAIVLMAFALVGMLGFAAVALDGGNIYAEQRRAQSAADAAVLAAAYQSMRGVTSTTTINNSALTNATVNGYDNNSTSNWVQFYRPPLSGAYVGNSAYMQVVITERIPTALAHLVYKGPFQLSVSAVAYAKTGGPPVDGNAVVALNGTGCKTVQVNGNGGMNVSGGGIFANSNGSACNGGGRVVYANGNGNVDATPSINIVAPSAWAYTGDIGSPTITSNAPSVPNDPLNDLNPPVCTAIGSPSVPQHGTINPGTYDRLDANGTLILNPGIYCITSTSGRAIDMGPSDVITGSGVTIYLQYGGMQITQGIMNLKAPSKTYNPACATLMPWDAPDTSPCHYVGMLLFIGRTNTNNIKMAGQGGWNLEGTLYGPKTSIDLDGNGDWGLTGQVLANNFSTEGNGDMNIYFDPNVIYSPPPAISLVQ